MVVNMTLDGDVLSPDDVASKSKIGGRRRRRTRRRRKKKKRKNKEKKITQKI